MRNKKNVVILPAIATCFLFCYYNLFISHEANNNCEKEYAATNWSTLACISKHPFTQLLVLRTAAVFCSLWLMRTVCHCVAKVVGRAPVSLPARQLPQVRRKRSRCLRSRRGSNESEKGRLRNALFCSSNCEASVRAPFVNISWKGEFNERLDLLFFLITKSS